MHTKNIEDFIAEASTLDARSEFRCVEEEFLHNAELIKINKHTHGITGQYSYIWYIDPLTNEKIAIRMSNKTIRNYILGSGTFGLAKYGIDKNGKSYAIKIQHNHITKYYVRNDEDLGITTKIQIQRGNSVHNPRPKTFMLMSNILYFQAERNKPPIKIPYPPANNPELRNIYNTIVQSIQSLNCNRIYSTHSQSGRLLTGLCIKLLIASNIMLKHTSVNSSLSPIQETELAFDVRLAHGKQTRRETTTFIPQDRLVDNKSMRYGVLYLYRTSGGFIGYKTLDIDLDVIDHQTCIEYPTHGTITQNKQLTKSIMQRARAQQHIPLREERNTKALTGEKQYQIIQLGESTLYHALGDPITLDKKITIARRVSWECSKLHTGKLSRSHRKYIHCDLKPANIILNSAQNNVLLIDYGISVTANTTGTLFGTTWYTPVIEGTDCRDKYADNFDSDYAARVANSQTSFDVFSLKRTIYMPEHQDHQQRCIFNMGEWCLLPVNLRQGIEIAGDKASTYYAMREIKRNNETALELTIRFIAMEAVDLQQTRAAQELAFNTNLQQLTSSTMTTERQEMVCECAEILDYIQTIIPKQTIYTLPSIINAAANEDQNQLPNLTLTLAHNACLLLINQINNNISIYEQWNTLLTTIIRSSDTEINAKITHVYELFQTIKYAAQSTNSRAALNELFLKNSNSLSISVSHISSPTSQESTSTDSPAVNIINTKCNQDVVNTPDTVEENNMNRNPSATR